MNFETETFEENRSLEQGLTFTSAEQAFQLYGVAFSREKYRALGMTQQKDGKATITCSAVSDFRFSNWCYAVL